MTRETKLGLLVGLGIILVIGIVVSDHMSVASQQHPPTLSNTGESEDGRRLPGAGEAAGAQRTTPIYTEQDLRQQLRHEQSPPATGREQMSEGSSHPLRVMRTGVDETRDTGSAGQPQVHYVREGENLWTIAQQYYGDGRKYDLIEAANPGKLLPNGDVRKNVRLIIPALHEPPQEQSTAQNEQTPSHTPAPQREQMVPPHLRNDGPRRIEDLRPRQQQPQQRQRLRRQRIETAGNTAANAAMASTIEVREGDTLSSLAARHLGDQSRYMDLYRANKDVLANPDTVRPGMTLKLPVDVVAEPRQTAANRQASVDRPSPRSGANSAIYVVQPGDTLSRIAARKLGDESKWHELWQHNRNAVPDADNLQPGTEIRIP